MRDMRDLGADGYRFDAAKHIDESFFADYASRWAASWNMFRVGEVFSGSVDYVQGYVNAGPGMHAFDYPLYFVIRGVFDYGDMRRLQGAGLVARNPDRAMPFVENHDRIGPNQYDLAHAFVLTIEGYPVLYNRYPNWLLSYEPIENMVWVKKNLAGGPTRWRYTDGNLAVYEREGNLLVGLNNSTNPRSEWVDTSWTDTELEDHAGNAGNITTESDGRVAVTVPAEGWVFYAPTGQGSDPDTDAPTASFTLSPASPDEGESVSFDASGSSDDVGVVSYQWEFGDGSTATGPTPAHTYGDPGQYTVTLTVTDDAGNSDTDATTVDVTDSAPSALPGASGPPTNVDTDDLLEDVDGDGKADVFDVLTYHDTRNSDTIRDNPGAFDFDGDGVSGTVFDALKLYEEIS